jgi:hypothetical protein
MEDDLLNEIMARQQASELAREVRPEPTPAASAPSGTLFIRSDDRNYAAARDEESRTYPVTPAAQDSAPTSDGLLYEIMNLPAHPRDLPGTFSSGWISGHKDALYQAAKLVTAFASAPNTRDPWRGGESYEASMLRNLLSIIHGQGQCDGYRYIEEHGLEKALTDAGAKVVELFNKTAAAAQDAARYRWLRDQWDRVDVLENILLSKSSDGVSWVGSEVLDKNIDAALRVVPPPPTGERK